MSMAQQAAAQINAYCRLKWPDDREANMASTWAQGAVIDAYDHLGHGSHKYIPSARYTADLNEREGAGVYGYWIMADQSYLLLTCRGPLAYADTKDSTARWGEFAFSA